MVLVDFSAVCLVINILWVPFNHNVIILFSFVCCICCMVGSAKCVLHCLLIKMFVNSPGISVNSHAF